MRPPGGAEFGKTEVFYLSVCDTNRDRASALAAALCGQLEQRMQQLRDQRAKSMMAELERTVAMADDDLAATDEANCRRSKRRSAPISPNCATSTPTTAAKAKSRRSCKAIEAERRANDATHRENVRLAQAADAGQDDPQQLLATPSSLLKSQPAVSQLKDALVDAQMRTASLLGSRVGRASVRDRRSRGRRARFASNCTTKSPWRSRA